MSILPFSVLLSLNDGWTFADREAQYNYFYPAIEEEPIPLPAVILFVCTSVSFRRVGGADSHWKRSCCFHQFKSKCSHVVRFTFREPPCFLKINRVLLAIGSLENYFTSKTLSVKANKFVKTLPTKWNILVVTYCVSYIWSKILDFLLYPAIEPRGSSYNIKVSTVMLISIIICNTGTYDVRRSLSSL